MTQSQQPPQPPQPPQTQQMTSWPSLESPRDVEQFLQQVRDHIYQNGYILQIPIIALLPTTRCEVCGLPRLPQQEYPHHECPNCLRQSRRAIPPPTSNAGAEERRQQSLVASLLTTPRVGPIYQSPFRPTLATNDDVLICPKCGGLATRRGACHYCNDCGEPVGGCS